MADPSKATAQPQTHNQSAAAAAAAAASEDEKGGQFSICKKLEELYHQYILQILQLGFGCTLSVQATKSDKRKGAHVARHLQLPPIDINFSSGRNEEGKLPAKSLALVIGFLCRYIRFVWKQSQQHGWEPASYIIQELIGPLSNEYVESVKPNMLTAIQKMQQTEENLEDQPSESKEGYVYTHMGADLFSFLQRQLSLAKRNGFHAQAYDRIVVFALQQIHFLQVAQIDWLGTARIEDQTLFLRDRTKSDAHLAAIINAAIYIDTHLENFMKGSERSSSEISDIKYEWERKVRQKNEQMKSTTSDIITRLVVSTLSEVCERFFTKEHINSPRIIEELIATLYDFFSDFRRWIRDITATERLVSLSVGHIAALYVRALVSLQSARKWSRTKEGNNVLQRIQSDSDALRNFLESLAAKFDIEASFQGEYSAWDTVRYLLMTKDAEAMGEWYGDFIDYFGRVQGAEEILNNFDSLIHLKRDLSKADKKHVLEDFKRQLHLSFPGLKNADKELSPSARYIKQALSRVPRKSVLKLKVTNFFKKRW